MSSPGDVVDGLPDVCGAADVPPPPGRPGEPGSVRSVGDLDAACAVALHMHQPQIPAGGGDLGTAAIISNLQHMMENQHIGDNHNAPVFRWCYKRMGEFVPALIDEGREPRVMLDYSGTLFWGLRQMGADDVFDALRRITCEPRYRRAVEWLGTPWGHAVAPSTPEYGQSRMNPFRIAMPAYAPQTRMPLCAPEVPDRVKPIRSTETLSAWMTMPAWVGLI